MRICRTAVAGIVGMLLYANAANCAQMVTVTARVAPASSEGSKSGSSENVLVWLTPLGGSVPLSTTAKDTHFRLTQKNKSFQPHILVVPVGTVVEFPNQDPFFHNVFSLFEGKRFDLGLYEAGSTRDVHFNRPGISYIFCNIHAEMSAVVIALDTPYYAISSRQGEIVIRDVPVGRYTLRIWYEGALPETLNAMTREITVTENSSTLGVMPLAAGNVPHSHKNKYGRDYDNPTPTGLVYERQ